MKTLGYGYKLSNETISEALKYYGNVNEYDLHKNKKEVLKQIERDKVNAFIPLNSKPKIFKLIVEVL